MWPDAGAHRNYWWESLATVTVVVLVAALLRRSRVGRSAGPATSPPPHADHQAPAPPMADSRYATDASPADAAAGPNPSRLDRVRSPGRSARVTSPAFSRG